MDKNEFSKIETKLVTYFDLSEDLHIDMVFNVENYDNFVNKFFEIFNLYQNEMIIFAKKGFRNIKYGVNVSIEYYNSFAKHYLEKIKKDYFNNILSMKFEYYDDKVFIEISWA